jgi:hypothetical protein
MSAPIFNQHSSYVRKRIKERDNLITSDVYVSNSPIIYKGISYDHFFRYEASIASNKPKKLKRRMIYIETKRLFPHKISYIWDIASFNSSNNNASKNDELTRGQIIADQVTDDRINGILDGYHIYRKGNYRRFL